MGNILSGFIDEKKLPPLILPTGKCFSYRIGSKIFLNASILCLPCNFALLLVHNCGKNLGIREVPTTAPYFTVFHWIPISLTSFHQFTCRLAPLLLCKLVSGHGHFVDFNKALTYFVYVNMALWHCDTMNMASSCPMQRKALLFWMAKLYITKGQMTYSSWIGGLKPDSGQEAGFWYQHATAAGSGLELWNVAKGQWFNTFPCYYYCIQNYAHKVARCPQISSI